ncbi:MAG: hypothetical protein H6868_05945 [Rhodospirillales bacterium]|nr:hypothetical protein [Rhodospirillales bacterium]
MIKQKSCGFRQWAFWASMGAATFVGPAALAQDQMQNVASTLAVSAISNDDLYRDQTAGEAGAVVANKSVEGAVGILGDELNSAVDMGLTGDTADEQKSKVKYKYGQTREDYRHLPIPPRVFNNID